jgi:hypothetical protein
LKRYNSGELPNNGTKQNRPSPYDDVKEKVLEYIELRARLYKRNKCGLSWALLKHKSLVFAEQLGHDVNTFKAGDYFIACIELHGEGMDMSEKDQAKNRETFFSSLRKTIEKFDITLDRYYNADQYIPTYMYPNIRTYTSTDVGYVRMCTGKL